MKTFTRILNFIILLTIIFIIIAVIQWVAPVEGLFLIGAFSIGWWVADLGPFLNAFTDSMYGFDQDGQEPNDDSEDKGSSEEE